MGTLRLLLLVVVVLALGVGTGYAAAPRVPTGAVNLVVQPATHFDVTCAEGTQLGFVTDGESEGLGIVRR